MISLNKKLVIIIAVIALVISGSLVFYFLKNQSTTAQSSANSTNITPQTVVKNLSGSNQNQKYPRVEITITANGFSPQTLTIQSGTRVVFLNKSGTEVSVNSDPHPLHTDYPPLNLGVIENGKSKSLVFLDPGRHGYHNHFDSTQTGAIIVE